MNTPRHLLVVVVAAAAMAGLPLGGRDGAVATGANVAHAAPAAADEAADRAALLDGVDVVGRPGAPGVVSVFGDRAFAVLTGGPRDRPQAVVAAARLGAGRVVAFAHDGYLSAEFLARDTGAARLVANAVRWAAAPGSPGSSLSKPHVSFVGDGAALAAYLSRAGFDVERGVAAKDCVKIVIDTDAIDDAAARAIEEHVRGGGGVIAAICPWGWEQVRESRGLRLRTGSPLNRLLARAGLAFADGIPDATDAKGFAVAASSPDAVHAGRALSEAGAKDARSSPEVVVDALRAVPPDEDDFGPRVAALAAKIRADDFPRPGRPLGRRTKDDIRARIAVAWRSLAWQDLPPEQVRAVPGAEDFPGSADGAVPHTVAITLTPDLPGWRSTGLYLRPGETLTVVPRSATTGAKDAAPRWRLRIGCHTDSLWHIDALPRWPEIAHTVPLAAGETRVATPWGGPVYVEALAGAKPLDVEVRGAVDAPLFDLRDPDRAKTWPARRRAPGPWAELVGEHLVLSLPSAAVRELADPEPLLRWWDSVVATHCELAGVPVPARPERFVCDAEISAGYMHAGYPIMMHLDVGTPAGGRPAPLVDLERLRKEGTWGPFHELGHNRQRGWWTFDGTVEVTCNLFSLHAGETLCGIRPWENPWLEGQKAAAAEYLAKPDFGKWKSSPGIALTTYAVLQREFGWAPFRRVFADMEALPDAQRPRADQAKIDQFVLRLSAACGRDLRPYVRRWAWPLSEAALRDAAVGKLPAWEPDLSVVKPGSK